MAVRVAGIRVVALAGASGTVAAWLAGQAVQFASGPPTLDSVVTAAISAGGALAAAYLAVASVAAWVESALTGRAQGRGLPLVARRFLVVGVAASVALGGTFPAGAADVYPGWVAPDQAGTPHASPSESPAAVTAEPPATPDPRATRDAIAPPAKAPPAATPTGENPQAARPGRSPQPSTPSGTGADSTAPRGAPTEGGRADAEGASSPQVHVVRRGESLWRIASDVLGGDASDADVASAWPLIYAANRPLIGGDPGLILPGQSLAIPAELGR